MGEEIKQSESPLYSDFERLANLLNDAQALSRKNRDYNPAIFRDYFIVLAEIQRFLYPMFGGSSDKMGAIVDDVYYLDKITRKAHMSLVTEKDFRVPSEIFEALSDLHTDLLVLKQAANLGIKVRENLTAKKKLNIALE